MRAHPFLARGYNVFLQIMFDGAPEVFNEIIIITLVITFITVPIRCARMKPEHTIDDKSDKSDTLTNWEHKKRIGRSRVCLHKLSKIGGD